jgi:hypothetical protein
MPPPVPAAISGIFWKVNARHDPYWAGASNPVLDQTGWPFR